MVRPILQLEQEVVLIDPEDQEFLLPADQLPNLPCIDLEQELNTNPQLNPPNQPLDLPTEEVDEPNLPLDQQNQQQDLPTEQSNQPQNPPAEHQIKEINITSLKTPPLGSQIK